MASSTIVFSGCSIVTQKRKRKVFERRPAAGISEKREALKLPGEAKAGVQNLIVWLAHKTRNITVGTVDNVVVLVHNGNVCSVRTFP